MVAMMLPPKVGRVWSSSRFSISMSRPVQSAVRPVLRTAATRGKNERPSAVAPAMTISGRCTRISSTRLCAQIVLLVIGQVGAVDQEHFVGPLRDEAPDIRDVMSRADGDKLGLEGVRQLAAARRAARR